MRYLLLQGSLCVSCDRSHYEESLVAPACHPCVFQNREMKASSFHRIRTQALSGEAFECLIQFVSILYFGTETKVPVGRFEKKNPVTDINTALVGIRHVE